MVEQIDGKTILKQYLFGTAEVPTDFNLRIRALDAPPVSVSLSGSLTLDVGHGRFAWLSRSNLVEAFFGSKALGVTPAYLNDGPGNPEICFEQQTGDGGIIVQPASAGGFTQNADRASHGQTARKSSLTPFDFINEDHFRPMVEGYDKGRLLTWVKVSKLLMGVRFIRQQGHPFRRMCRPDLWGSHTARR